MTRPAADFESMAPRDCTTCKGTGEYVSAAFTSLEGKVYPETRHACSSCSGAKRWPVPDYKALGLAIVATKGKNKGKLRASPPTDPFGRGFRPAEVRAYYVWRWVRFHGGRDVTLPMTAEMMSRGDPFRPELDALAEWLAKRLCGTDMAGAYRWSGLLRSEVPIPAGLPATAYPSSPVADENKPDFERPEMSDSDDAHDSETHDLPFHAQESVRS